MVYVIEAALCHKDKMFKIIKFNMEIKLNRQIDIEDEGSIYVQAKEIILKNAGAAAPDIVAVGLVSYKRKS